MGGFNEDNLVQRTMADYLRDQLGWQSIVAFDREDFGPDSMLGRADDREVVLTRPLRAKLVEFNPGLPNSAYDDAVRQLTAIVASQSIIAANREKYALIRDGVPVTFRNEKGEREKRMLTVIDFDDHSRNDFLCVREMFIYRTPYRKRPDIIGFVNGLPLLFVECKNINKNLKVAFDENYSDYRDTIPHIFHHNAIVMFANGEKARIGSITSKWDHFFEWKRLSEDAPATVDMETLIRGVCDKRNLLDLIENFILFDDSSGETRKIVAKNHQFLGVNRAIDAVDRRKELDGRLGVFWHTQGAGKSYSMVFFTRKIHRKRPGGFTFLILTDREDLDAQIYKTFAGCGVVNHDRDPCRANDGGHLQQLLGQQKTHVFSLIQKFHQRIEAGGEYTLRDDVIVISDEAHRTQYGTLALNMRDALPNASYIGFTGTPLMKGDEPTRKVFGNYVSTYDFQRAVEDKATVPLYYDARGDKLGLGIGDLNERIAEKLESLEIENIDVAQRLESELKRDYHVITAQKRLEQVARDFVQHYSKAWESGKAMLVCIDKLTCVKMYDLIVQYWDEQIVALEKEVKQSKDEQEEILLQRRIAWMKETRAAVVVSEEQGEVDKFRKWGLDIKPHRDLIKNGIDLPESLRHKPEYRNQQRMDLDEAFKEEDHPFRIAIVCAMWLTGFDVPCLSTLYLDKPLKAHTLMQAIARANRVHEGKNNGWIVDYCGILKHLRQALATFAGAGDGSRQEGDGGNGDDPTKPEDELLADLADSIAFVRAFLTERAASLDEIIEKTGFERNAAIVKAKEAVNENDESRKRFEVMCREVFKKFKACINVPGINDYREDYGAINIVYKSLQSDREKADISDIIRQLHEVVDDFIETRPEQTVTESKPYDISKIDFDRLRAEFERSPQKKTTVQNLKQAIETRVQRLLMQNPLRTDLQQHYEEIVAEYNREKDRVTIEKSFEAFIKFVEELSDEEQRALREGLDEESLAIFDLIKKPDLTPNETKKIKAVAASLLETLKAEKLKVYQWRDRESTRDAVSLAIKDYLWSDQTGLPADHYDEKDVEAKAQLVYEHVLRVYPTVPSPYYEGPEAA